MKTRTTFTKRDVVVCVGCVLFLLANLGAVGQMGHRRAKAAVCQANLSKWGIICQMYASDHNGRFWGGWLGKQGATGQNFFNSNWWFGALWPYYREVDLRLCPEACKPYYDNKYHYPIWTKSPFGAWTGGGFLTDDKGGSYGINGWVEDNQGTEWGLDPEKRWRTIHVASAEKIPLMLGCVWIDGWPEPYHVPPQSSDIADLGNYMQRFVVNRHEGRVGGVFMDGGARMIGLKELWTLKWHRKYDVDGPWTVTGGVQPGDWPEWMQGFEDY